jgi:dTDP-4-amino-4,6-dideoxygalactose transaminase
MIPLVDLKLQYAEHRKALDEAMRRVCESAAYILGPAVEQFEHRFARYLGAEAAIGVGNGSDALYLLAKALGILAGDEVLLPANTFIATAAAMHPLGAVPVPVDIDPATLLMDLSDARRRITRRARAIIPVHLYGRAMDMDAVLAFAREHDLLVIEDACQAHGAAWKGRRVGTFGHGAAFSFYPAKNLGCFGDGGMVIARDAGVARSIRLLRNYGSLEKNRHEVAGGNSRLDSLQAAVLDVKLDWLDDWNRVRFRAACRYADRLEGVGQVRAPAFDRGDPASHVFHLFVIECGRRDELMAMLAGRGIQCGIHYPVPIHLHPAFAHLGLGPGTCPVAERLAGRILSLPMFPEITDEQIDAVTAAIEEFYA